MKMMINSFFDSISYKIARAIIDPGDDWEFKRVKAVLLTHCHFDHIYGLNKLLKNSPNAFVYTNAIGRDMLLNAKKNLSFYYNKSFVFNFPENIITVKEGERINIGYGLDACPIFTPGHNDSCISWIVGKRIFTGDSYIPKLNVVTNLPGGNKEKASESINLILSVSQGKTIYPGHKVSI